MSLWRFLAWRDVGSLPGVDGFSPFSGGGFFGGYLFGGEVELSVSEYAGMDFSLVLDA